MIRSFSSRTARTLQRQNRTCVRRLHPTENSIRPHRPNRDRKLNRALKTTQPDDLSVAPAEIAAIQNP
jgi:hypothetical protein